ncbi:MAG: ribosomal RNA small subunit methyltransferase A [Deltaproteobacteria bacterium]|nr:ribosomal RNA small subunit methyltransferase A [Deltaproteobacteria bacterium]
MTSVRKVLKDYGIRPLKRLGQSFLQDINVINKIVGLADIRSDETVIEIGAGIGVVTELIALKAGRVIALEVDPRMVAVLRERLAHIDHVTVIHADVLQYDFSSCDSSSSRKMKIIGNIPYHISSQILFHLLSYRQHISTMILMFQKELADRLVASPGTKEYGIPSVMVSMYTHCSRELTVPGSCFYPEPEVKSSVLKMDIRERPRVELNDHLFFSRVVRTAFSQRRKTLMNNLRSSFLPRFPEYKIAMALREAGIDGRRRGESLTPEELGVLSNTLHLLENLLEKS